MEIQKNSQPSPIDSTPMSSKVWYRHRGILAIIILGLITALVVGVYLIQDNPNYVKPLTQNQPTNVPTNSQLSLKDCDGISTNSYELIDPNITDLISKNSTALNYIREGYVLERVCKASGKTLLLMDFEEGYWNNAGKVTETQLNKMAEQLVLGVGNSNLSDLVFYSVSVPDYRFEGTGGIGCNFDSISGSYILYICSDASDSGENKTWYAYDTQNKKNITVRQSFIDFEDSKFDKDTKYRADLLSLYINSNVKYLPVGESLEWVEGTKWNFDPPTTFITYSNPEKGFSFLVPYNENWGGREFKMRAYEETKDGKIYFGNVAVGCEGDCSMGRDAHVYTDDYQSAQSLVEDLNNGKIYWEGGFIVKPTIVNLGSLQAVEYEYGELGSQKFVIVTGKKFNYVFSAYHIEVKDLELVAKTIKFN